jgi:hypothetical protein
LRLLLAVNIHGNENAFGNDQIRTVGLERAEEATAVALVADAGSEWFDEEQEGIAVTIHANLADEQNMTASLTLFPKAIAGTGKEVNLAGALRLFERFGIEVAEHEDLPRAMVLDDARDEITKFFKCHFHNSLPKKQKTRRAFRASGLIRA